MELKGKEEVAELRGSVGSDCGVCVLWGMWECGDVERNCRISGRVPVVMMTQRRERRWIKGRGRELSKLVNCAANTISTRCHASPLPKSLRSVVPTRSPGIPNYPHSSPSLLARERRATNLPKHNSLLDHFDCCQKHRYLQPATQSTNKLLIRGVSPAFCITTSQYSETLSEGFTSTVK